jgi:L-lactate dehydrogenase
MKSTKSKGKVSIIGTGLVGSTTAFALTMSGLLSELVLIDSNKSKAQGEVLDLNHGRYFYSNISIISGDLSDIKDSDIIIISEPNTPQSEQTSITHKVAEIKDLIPNIMRHYTGGVILVAQNPVDILTYIVQKLSALPENKIIGTGTVLESSKLRYLLSEHCNMDAKNIHAYIIGEHGDSQFPVWSATNIAGQKYDDFCAACTKKCGNTERYRIFNEVKNAESEIMELKEGVQYSVAMAITRIVEAILKNQNSILPVSSVVKGSYGINDVALSLPAVINYSGIERMFDISLTQDEQQKLEESSLKLKEIIKEVM